MARSTSVGTGLGLVALLLVAAAALWFTNRNPEPSAPEPVAANAVPTGSTDTPTPRTAPLDPRTGHDRTAAIPASRHRVRSSAHDSGRYNSASSRAWNVPFATPMCTVTTPLSILPTHPRYCRCTPGV